MKKHILLTTLLLSALTVTAQAQTLNSSEIDGFINAQMKRFAVPGLGLAIVKDGKVVYSKGYGLRDSSKKEAVNADTLFAIGSSTKSFTSLGIMQLVEAGKLNLDTPVNTYLPDLKFSDANKAKSVTLRRLLSMSSGLPRADQFWAFDPSVKTRTQMLQTISQIPFTAEVGQKFQYCNQNFTAAGAVLEKIGGQSWEAYSKANILTPLGMNRTVFDWDSAVKDGNYATGHGVGLTGAKTTPSFDRFAIVGPAGSIHASANDMGKYLMFQLNGGKLVSNKSLETMHSQTIRIRSEQTFPGVADTGYGLGWFNEEYRGVRLIEHGGNINGFSTEMQIIPSKGIGFVIMVNLDGAGEFGRQTRLGLTERLLDIKPRNDLEGSSFERNQAILEGTRTYKAAPEQLRGIEGTYTLIDGSTFKVSVQNNQAMLEQNGLKLTLLPASATQYIAYSAELNLLVTLTFENTGDFIWVYQDEQVIGVRTPSPASSSTALATVNTITDSKKTYSFTLPSTLKLEQSPPNTIIATSSNPEGTFVFATAAAQATLEDSALVILKQFDPTFALKPVQKSVIPVGGINWTQLIYVLPNDQILAALVTQRGNTVHAIVVQASSKNINSLAQQINDILSSYKFL
jgi:CubicO group peptidase (beta-lactamase class C family)